MVFLRKSRSPLPRYVEYLYYIIPFTIAIIHSMVHIIISATEGVCDMFNLVPNASKSYVIYVIFQCLLLPSIFIFYNVIATVTIIVTLYLRQRRVGRALELVSRRTRELFVTGKDDKDAGLRTISAKEAEHLKTAQKVYSACIRIALYPLAPVIWWIFLTIYYTLQYPITLTYKSDVPKLLKIDILTWFAYTGISFINFVVFVTDPALKKVISEVRSAIRMKLAERRMRASSSQDTLASSDDSITKLPDMVLSESYESDATHDNNVTSVGLRNDMHYTNSFYSADRFGTLEGSQSTSTMVLNSDSVVRRIRSDGDADSFMDKL
ncbi:hypothetical protein EV175_002140 [Coemansia sp. RSA 1933]|nr:hypothetical protein EV175_002140 [Coemansia sp. RSA 1933]